LSIKNLKFSFIPINIYYFEKIYLTNISNVQISTTDWQLIYEIIIFFYLLIYFHLLINSEINNQQMNNYIYISFLPLFASYFKSGIQKITVTNFEDKLFYLTDNLTSNILKASLVSNSSPFVYLPIELQEKLIFYIDFIIIPINLFVVFIEIFAILFYIFNKKLNYVIVGLITLHISIFLLTGIFFFKWIILEILLLIYINQVDFKANIKWIPSAVLIIIFNFLFFIPSLGWYDSHHVNNIKIYGQNKYDNYILIPPQHFKNFSLMLSQNRAVSALPYPSGTYGSLRDGSLINKSFFNKLNFVKLNCDDILSSNNYLDFISNYEYEKTILGDFYMSHIISTNISYSKYFSNPSINDIKINKIVVEAYNFHENTNVPIYSVECDF